MGMNVGSDSGEDEVIASINTTPLVDVMLVLLIIFLITIPAIIQIVPVDLPKERNLPTETKPENIVISVNKTAIFSGDSKRCRTRMHCLNDSPKSR